MGGLNSGPGPGITLLIAIVVVLAQTVLAAPVHEDEEAQESNSHALAESHGCYYNFQHYNEGERILTNEPCLNCTCRNRMLMCYLRVCPFTKGIGQNCTVEKVPGQCCPIITCPEVPVQLLTSTTTEHSEGGKAPSHHYGNKGTAVGHLDTNGCNIDGIFYPNGAQVPGSPEKPCELCYCIRNKTACIMQECALHVDGCRPVYEEGQCFPVRYQCDDSPYEEEPTTTIRPAPTPGLIITTTSSEPLECSYNNDIYEDGSRIQTEDPCEHCYCLKGKIACAVQECGAPLEKDGQNCTALPPAPGKCCPDSYQCDNNVIVHPKENFVRKDRKQKFEPKPIEHNDITMTSQGLSSGSEGTTQSGIPSVADAGHPTDGYHPDGGTTEKPKLTTNRFDEEFKVTEGVTPAKGIATPSVTPAQQQELDKGTQQEKDSRPAKPIGDQKITFPDELKPTKGETTVTPVDHTDAQIIHMSAEKQPHPDIESHKQGVASQTGTNDILSVSSTPSAKDPLIDKLHNIIQDVQSQVEDGKTSQMPEEVDMQTTTQSQKGHFTEKPDVLSHLPHSSTPSAEITNTTKESSSEDTNILNQIQGIIQGIYSHVTDSIMSTKYPESTTEVGQLPGQEPIASEKEGVAGSYPSQYPEGSQRPEYPHEVTEKPKRPIGAYYPEGATDYPDVHKPHASTKHPEKFGSHEESYGTQYPDEIGGTGRPEGATKFPEVAFGTQYPEGVTGRPKDPSKHPAGQYPSEIKPGDSKYPEGQYPHGYPTGQYPESTEVTGKPYDSSKYPESLKPDHHPSGVTKSPEGVTGQYPIDSKYPQGYKPGQYSDASKFPEGASGKPEYPDGQYPDSARPTGDYPESSGVTGKPYEPYDSSKYPSGQYPEDKYPEGVTGKPHDSSKHPSGQQPGIKPSGEHSEIGTTGKPESEHPEGVTGESPVDSKFPGVRPTGEHPATGKPFDQSQYPESGKPSQKYPNEEYPESVTGRPEDQTQYPQEGKPTGLYPSGSQYPEAAGVTKKPQYEGKYPEGVKSTEQYPVETKYPDAVDSKPAGGINYPDNVKPSDEYSTEQSPAGVTEKPEENTKYPQSITGRPDQTKYPTKPEGTYGTEYPDSEGKPDYPNKHSEGVHPTGQKPEGFKPSGTYPNDVTGKPDHETKQPASGVLQPSEHYPENVHSGTQKYPQDGKPTSADEAYGTEYPEGETGKPFHHEYPTRPGYPSRPAEQYTEQYPDGVTGKPEDHTKYPGQRPGVFRPTGEYPDDSKHPEYATGKPEDSTSYPHGFGTDYPEGITGKPKDPSKYPEGIRPSDRYPDVSKYPEGVTGRPEDHTKYPGQHPGVFRPSGENASGKPEDSTSYPHGFGTDYPEGITGKPKDPSKYPEGIRPSDRYPDVSKYPEGVTGRPEDHTKYPGQRPGVFKPTGEYPDDSKHPEYATGKPEDKTPYPYGSGTEYPEGISGRPKDPSKYPEGIRPSDRYPDVSKYPEGVTGRPEDHTRYPGQRPGVLRPTGQYPDETKHPEYGTGKPEDSTSYPYGSGTDYPEGVTGRPKDPSKYPEGIRPSDRYPDLSKYPEGITGRPEDHTKYPGQRPGVLRPTGQYPDDSKHPEYATGKPEDSTSYPHGSGTDYPEGVTGKPKDPSKYPEGIRPSDNYPDVSKYPEGVTGRPEDHTKYPGQRPGVLRPTGQYPDDSKHPEYATGKPEDSTSYPHGFGTDYPEGITGRPKDPSKYPEGIRPSDRYPDVSKYPEGVTGRPEDYTRYPGQRPGVSRPTGKYPDESKHPELVTGRPEGTTYYPEGEDYGTEYSELKGRPKDPSKYPGVGSTGVTRRPEEETKYPDGVKPGFKPNEKYPHKPEDGTKYPEFDVTGKPEDEYLGVKPTGQYPTDSKRPEKVSLRPSDSTQYPEKFKPTGHYGEEVTDRPDDLTKYPEGVKPSGQIPDDLESFSKYPDGIIKKPEDQTSYPEGTADDYSVDSKYPAGTKPDKDSVYPDTQDHTKRPQKPSDNIYGTEYPESSGKPASENLGVSKYPSGTPHDASPQTMPIESGKPLGSDQTHTLHGTESSKKPTSTEYPKGAKPSRPYHRPGLQDESFGTEYPETTEHEYESESGTEYPESATKYSIPSNYPIKRPAVGDKDQQKPVAEDETGSEHFEGSTPHLESDSYPAVSKRPGLKPQSTPEGVTDIPEGLKPQSSGDYPSEPGSSEQPQKKPVDSSYGTEHSEADRDTERPHYTSKYPEKPSAEDQLLGTERPDSKVTFHPAGADHPSGGENKRPAEGVKQPDENWTKSPYYTSKRPPRPGHPEDSKLPTKDTPYVTEYPVSGATDQYPEGSKRPTRPKPAVEEGSKYPGSEDEENKYPEGITGRPAGYPSTPDDQFHGVQTKYPESAKPDDKIPHRPESGTEYPQTGITEYPKGKPQHSTKYPEGSEPSDDKTGGQTPEDLVGHGTGRPLDQYPGAQYPEGVTGHPEYPEGSIQTDQSPTKTTNTTKESSPDESTNILNQIQGIIQGIYSQVTDSIMSTIRPESATVVGQGGDKPQESDDGSHSGQTGTEQPFGTELPDGVKYPEHPEGMTGRPQTPSRYPETDEKHPETLAGHPDEFRPTGSPSVSTEPSQNLSFNKETSSTQRTDQTGQTRRPEGSAEYTGGDEVYGTEYPHVSGRPTEPSKYPEEIKPGQQPEGFKPAETSPIDGKYPDTATGRPQGSKPGSYPGGSKYPEGVVGKPEDHTAYPESIGETHKPQGSKIPEVQPTGKYPGGITERPDDYEKVRPTEQYPIDSKHPEGVKPSEQQPEGQKHTGIRPAGENQSGITGTPVDQDKYAEGVKPTGSYQGETDKLEHQGKYPEGQQPIDSKHPINLEGPLYSTEYPEEKPEYSTKYPEKNYGTEYPGVTGSPKDPSKHPEGQFPEQHKPQDATPAPQVGSKYPSGVSKKPEIESEEYPEEITGQPQYPIKSPELDADFDAVTSKYPQKQTPEIDEAYGTDYPEGSTHRPGLQPELSKPPVYRPKPGVEYPEESIGQTERPDDEPQSTTYPSKDENFSSKPIGKPKPITENLPEATGKPHGSSKYPAKPKPEYGEPNGTENPEPTDSEYAAVKPYKPSKLPDDFIHDVKYPEQLPETSDKYPQGGKPTSEDEAYGTEYPEGVTGKPIHHKYPTRPGYPSRPAEQYTEQYPEGVTGRPEDHTKYPGQRPGVFRPTGEYPDETKHPEYGTGKPEDSTSYPHGFGTDYPEGVTGRPKDPSKYPEGITSSDRYPDVSKYPEGVTGRPEDNTKHPGQRPGVLKPSGEYPDDSKHPEHIQGITGKPEDKTKYPGQHPGVFRPTGEYATGKPEDSTSYPYGSGTEYPESITGKPKDPSKYPEGIRPSDRYPDVSKYPEGVTGRPEDHTKYPGQHPGVFRPTGEYATGKPEDSTSYPYGSGTEYPEGITGKPKDPSKYPEGIRPSDRYPDVSKYPEGVTRRPEDHTKYPGQRPGLFRPTGEHPDDSKHPEYATGKPEDSTSYPHGFGTDYPEGITGKPKDPSKYPEGIRPSDRYPDVSKYPEGVTGRPEDHTRYPGQRPGVLRPTGQYPDETKHPEYGTGKPEDSTSYPYGSGTDYPEGVTGRPKDPSKYPEGIRPSDRYPDLSKYPEGITGRPEDHTKYPGQRPGVLIPTGQYPDDSKRPEHATGKPEDSTSYPHGVGTDYPEGITGRPKDPSKYPEGIRPSDRYPDVSKYPEGVTGRPEDHTKYPGQHPGVFRPTGENASGKPEDSTSYPHGFGTDYPEGITGRPKDPSKYPEGIRPSDRYPDVSKYPEGVTGRPEDHTRYPGQRPGVLRPTGEYPDDTKHPEHIQGITGRPEDHSKYPGQRPGVFRPTGEYPDDTKHPEYGTGKPEESTSYPYGSGTDYPEGITGKPKDPSKYPEGIRPSDRYPDVSKYPEGVTGRPEDHTKYPGQHPGIFRPSGEYPDDSKHPEYGTGKPEDSTSYPYGSGTDYPEGITGKPKDPSKYPEGIRPSDRYPDVSKYPEGVTGRPEDHTIYPGQHPGVFRPTGENASGKPEDSTSYPHGFGTDYPEGITGGPKDPSKYPDGIRPSDRYPDVVKHPSGVSERPEDHTKYPGHRPGVSRPTGEYPDESKHPGPVTGRPEGTTYYPEGEDFGPEYAGSGVTGKPEDGIKPSGQYPTDSKRPEKVSLRPIGSTQYPEKFKPTEHYGEGVTGKPDDLTKHPEWFRPSEEYPEGFKPAGSKQPSKVTDEPDDHSKHPESFKPTGKYPEGSSVSGKPEDQTEQPGARPSGEYPVHSKDPEIVKPVEQSESDYGTEYPESSTRYPGEFNTEYPEGVSDKPKDPSKYPGGVELPEGHKPTEQYPETVVITGKPYDPSKHPQAQYPEGVKPDDSKPSKESSTGSKYPENESGEPENQTKYPHVITGRPEGPVQSLEGDSHVTEHPTLGSRPRDPSKQPEAIQPGQHPEEFKPSEKHPEGTTKPEEDKKHPDEIRPSGYYPDGPEFPEASGVTKKPSDLSKYPGVKPTEQYEVDSKYPEGKPIGEYPHGVSGKPEDQTAYPEGIRPTQQDPENSKYPEKVKPPQHYPEGITGRPESTTYFPEEDYVTEYPGMSSKPKIPSKYPEGFKPEKYPDGGKPTGEHPGFSPTAQYPDDLNVKPEDYTKYPEGVRPSGQHPESFKPDGKHPQKPYNEFGIDYPQSVTDQYPGSTSRPHFSTKYPGEGKPHDGEGITGRPVYEADHPEGVKPTEQYQEGFKPTGQYPVDSEHPVGVTDKTGESSKYPEGFKPSEQIPDGSKPTDSKYPDKKPEDLAKQPEGVTGRPQDFTKYPEESTSGEQYDPSKHPQKVTGKPEDNTKYPEGVTQHYPDGSKYPEGIKPFGQYPESSGTTGKPQDVSKYPEDSKHPGISKPSAEYPYEQKPNEEYPDSITGKPESVTDYPEGDSHVTEYPGVSGRPKEPTKYSEKVKPGQHFQGFKPTEQGLTDTKYPEGITGEPEESTNYPEGVRPIGHYPEGGTEQYPVDKKHPVKVTGKPEDVSKYPEHPTKNYPAGITSRPEAVKPGQRPHQTEKDSGTDVPHFGVTGKPGHQSEYPEGYTGQYPNSTGKPQYVTKYPEDDTGVTHAPEEYHPTGSKDPNQPDGHITFPEDTKPSEGSKPFEKQPGLSSNEYPDGTTVKPHDYTKYPGESVKPEYVTNYPGGYPTEGSKYPAKPVSTSDSTEYTDVTGKYPEAFATEYPDGTKPTGQFGSKYPEGITGKPAKRPGFKPSAEPGHTILPMDLEDTSESGVVDLIEYTKKPKPEQASGEYSASTSRPTHKHPTKRPQTPDGLGNEATGTEYPETTEVDYELGTGRPEVTADRKPGESRPTKPGTEYLPQGGEKPSLQTHGLDENSLPSEETETNRTPIAGSEQGQPIDKSKPSSIDDYPSRPTSAVPDKLYNEDLTQKPLEQSTSGTGVHPTVELTPDVKIPEGDLVTGQPAKYPSTEKPLEGISGKPVGGTVEQLGTNRHPETTPDDDLINKLHNIISGIQSQTNIPSEHSTFSPHGVDEFGRPVSTEAYTTTKGSYVTDKPVEEGTQHPDLSKPVRPSQSLSTEIPKVSPAEYPEPTESDKTAPHSPSENTFQTITPEDGIQKHTSTEKPLHVVYPTYYPDGVITRKPTVKPDDGDKKVTVTPQSTHEKVPEREGIPAEYDSQTEISSEMATTPGVVIIEEVHTEIHSERPTKRPIFGSTITQSGSSDFTTHSGYQTEVPETTKPFYVTVTPAGTVSESDHIMHLYSPKEKHPTTDIPTTQSFATEPAVQLHTRFPSRKTTQTPIDELTTHKPQGASYVPYKLVNSTKVYYPEKELPQKPSQSGPYDGYDQIPYEVVNGTKFFYPNRVATEQPSHPSATLGMYVPYKIINGTKVYYTQDLPQEPEKYDGLDYVPFEIINGTKVFYPERVSTTPSPTTAMYVPFKNVNGNKVYYPKGAKDEPQDIADEYDGFDYVPYETVNGKKVFHPERVPNHTPAGSDYVPYKLMNNNKVYYPKDAQKEQEKIPEGYDGLDSVPYDLIDDEKVYYPMKAVPQKPSAMFVPYKLVNGTKVYYPKDAQDKPSQLPEGYDGFDYVPYDTVNGVKVFRPEKITSKPAYYPNKMFVPYKIINNTKVFYPKDAQNKPRPLKPEYDGIEYLPYDVVNGTKVFQPPPAPTSAMYVPYVIKNGEKVYDLKKATDEPKGVPEGYDGVDHLPYEMKDGGLVFYPERVSTPKPNDAMYVPYKLINGTKVYYADKAADKPEDVSEEFDGFDYLPYEVQNGNKIFYPDKAGTTTETPATLKPALYVPYKLIDGKKVYDTDKATDSPQDVPEEFDGFDYVPYDVKNGNKVFYPERVKPTPKEGAMYVPYKLNNDTKVYYADKATDKPEDITKDYDGFDYIPYELQNGNKLFYPDRVATPTTTKAMYVPYKLDDGKKIYQKDKATDNPQGVSENFDGFDYVPYNVENGNKVFYLDKVIPSKGSEYVPYKIVKGMKVYHPEKAAGTTQEIPEEFDGFDYLPFETKNGNKIFYPDRVTQAPKGAVYVPYKLMNGKKVYNPNKATNNPQDIPKGYDGCDYIPYEIKNGNKVFHPEQITTPAPTQGSMYVPYKIINGTKVYYADKATDKQEDVAPEYDGFDYLPYELQNGNKIFYPDKANTPKPTESFKYVPYKLVNGRKVYYPDRAADKPEDIPKGYDGFDYLPIEYTSKPQDSQGMFVPYKTINGTKIYYPQEAHKRPHPLSDEYSGLDYMPYETINGTKVFYPEREPQAMYVPYKVINGTKVFYPKDAQRTPGEIPTGYDGLDYVPYDIVNGSQIFHPDRVPEYQGMFVPYKIVNGKKVFYPKYAQHKPMLMDGYDGFDYLPYENVNGMKVFKPEVPEKAMYVPYKIINGTKVYYPKYAQRKPEVPVGYDGSDYIPYQLVNGTKIFDPSIRPAMYVPYKIMDGTKVYYPKHAQNKPENIPSGYDGHDYLPYEVINGNKVFKPEQATPQEQIAPQIKQAMYVPYKIVNGTKVYHPMHAQNKPEYIPDGYDGHDYLPYEIVNGNKVFKPEHVIPQIKQAMYVPYKIVDGTKVYHPKYAQHNPYLIPAGYDGFDYIPYEIVNGSKVFHPEQATTAPPPPKQAMYVPFKLVNGTKAYYPKHAQHAPTPVPSNYDGLDYLPYEVVNGTKIFEPQPHTKPTYLKGMFVPYKLSNNTKIFYPKDAHNKPHYVPQGYDGADYVPYEVANNTKLFYPELISMAQPSTANIPGIYVPFRLVNNKKVFYPKEATPFPPTVRYPYDGVAFVPYKSSVPSEIIYVDEDDLTKPHTLSGHVPGEGNCYLNNITYTNNTEVAPVSPCQARCTCISSVVRCVRVKCPPPPQNKSDCSPVYREGICCPTYSCGESEYEYPTTVGYPETKAPEGTSHGHDSESTTAFTDLTSQKKKPGSGEEGKPGQQSEEYHLHKPPKPSEHESLEPYDSVEGQLSPEEDYDVEDEEPYGPGTCRYAGKVYVSAQQIPRDDPCDFCFCFRSDIICLQQSCPPPIPGCRDEPIEGFCCPRYECHVKMATLLNVTSTTTTTTTTLPPHFFPHAYKGSATRTGCFVQGKAYRVGQPIPSASGPCMDCICGGNGRMKCEPKVCTPEPMIRKMMSPSESTTSSTNER